MVLGHQHEMMLSRDAAIADTVEWILRREGRVMLAGHSRLCTGACDVIVHLSHVTPADPDHAALACALADIQEAFSRWQQAPARPAGAGRERAGVRERQARG